MLDSKFDGPYIGLLRIERAARKLRLRIMRTCSMTGPPNVQTTIDGPWPWHTAKHSLKSLADQLLSDMIVALSI